MPKLQLVKPSRQEGPQTRRAVEVSGERRYRYPAEEIWEVSDDRWRLVTAQAVAVERSVAD